ncbi:hypothetical protein WN943_004314 [Citrus x changshan-huyou]
MSRVNRLASQSSLTLRTRSAMSTDHDCSVLSKCPASSALNSILHQGQSIQYDYGLSLDLRIGIREMGGAVEEYDICG